MTRQIVTKKDLESKAETAGATEEGALIASRSTQVEKPDGYLDRFLKYIPSEIIVIYITICGAIGLDGNHIALWVAYGLCQISVPIFLWKIAGVTKKKQLALSFLSFYFWAAAYGGPFHSIEGFHKAHNAFLLPLYTFFVPYFDEQDDDADDEEDEVNPSG